MTFDVVSINKVDKSQVWLLDAAFKVWLEVYSERVTSSGSRLDHDRFLASEKLAIIHAESEIKAFSLMNTYNLTWEKQIERWYFSYAPMSVQASLIESKPTILSVEWLTANPAVRGRFTRFQPNEVLLSLMFRYMKDSGYAACMGYSRTDIQADKSAQRCGAKPFAVTDRYGDECMVMMALAKDDLTHTDPRTEKHVKSIYDDYLTRTYPMKEAV